MFSVWFATNCLEKLSSPFPGPHSQAWIRLQSGESAAKGAEILGGFILKFCHQYDFSDGEYHFNLNFSSEWCTSSSHKFFPYIWIYIRIYITSTSSWMMQPIFWTQNKPRPTESGRTPMKWLFCPRKRSLIFHVYHVFVPLCENQGRFEKSVFEGKW